MAAEYNFHSPLVFDVEQLRDRKSQRGGRRSVLRQVRSHTKGRRVSILSQSAISKE